MRFAFPSVLFLLFLSFTGVSLSVNVSNCSVLSSADTYVLNQSIAGAPNNASPVTGNACVKIAASDVIFDCNGFGIVNNGTGANTHGILLNGSLTNVTVRNCTNISGYGYGIYVNTSNDSAFINNAAINHTSSGFYLNAGFGNNFSYNNARTGPHFGFFIFNSSNNTLSNNSGYDLLDSCFHIYFGSGNFLGGNLCNNSDDHGFLVNSSSNNALFNNSANNNQEVGFVVLRSPNTTLLSNIAYNNVFYGYQPDSSPYLNATSNLASNNGAYGFQINNLSDSSFSNNSAYGSNTCFNLDGVTRTILINNSAFCSSTGFMVSTSNLTTISTSMIYDCPAFGLLAFSSNLTISGNVVRNTTNGILVFGSNNTFADNRVYNTSSHAFNLGSGAYNLFINNSAYGSLAAAFYLSSYPNATFINNSAYNSAYGFLLYLSTLGNLTNNSAYNNSNAGFFLNSSSNNSLTNNSAWNNTDGFYLSNSSNNSLTNNSAWNNTDGFYLSNSSNITLTANYAHNNSNAGFRTAGSDNATICNNSAAYNANYGFYLEGNHLNLSGNLASSTNSDGYPYCGFYITSSNATVNGNTAFSNYYGFHAMLERSNVTNNVAHDDRRSGWYFASNYCNFSNNLMYNENRSGLTILGDYNNITNNTADNNSFYGFDMGTVSNDNVFMNNTASNNWLNGFGMEANTHDNTYIRNKVYGNLLSGFNFTRANNVRLDSNAIYGNAGAGICCDSCNVTSSNDLLYNNTFGDLWVNATTTGIINFSNVIFDSPSGAFQDFTNLSMNDSVEAGVSYRLNWSAAASAPPAGYAGVAGKFLNVTVLNGSPSIDSMAWNWRTDEISGYNESGFSLWKYNSSGWSPLNSSPDTGANTLSLSGVGSFGLFGLMQFNDTPAILPLLPADSTTFYSSTVTLTFAAVDNLSSTMNCSIILDGSINQTNSSVANGTQTSFTITSIAYGQHTWSVNCTNTYGNTGSSVTMHFFRDAESSPPHTSPQPEMLDVSIEPACNGFIVAVKKAGEAAADVFVEAGEAAAYTNATGRAFFNGCDRNVLARAAKSGAEGSADAYVACPVCQACIFDSDCGGNQTCTGGICTAVLPPVQPGTQPNQTIPAPPGPVPLGCRSNNECQPEQSCEGGSCINVTGVCGYAANHSWVKHACGPEPGCPSCQSGTSCVNHACVPGKANASSQAEPLSKPQPAVGPVQSATLLAAVLPYALGLGVLLLIIIGLVLYQRRRGSGKSVR